MVASWRLARRPASPLSAAPKPDGAGGQLGVGRPQIERTGRFRRLGRRLGQPGDPEGVRLPDGGEGYGHPAAFQPGGRLGPGRAGHGQPLAADRPTTVRISSSIAS